MARRSRKLKNQKELLPVLIIVVAVIAVIIAFVGVAYTGPGGSLSSAGLYTSIPFVGITPSTYSGSMGGYAGANAICDSHFRTTHMCSAEEIAESVDKGYDFKKALPYYGASAWYKSLTYSMNNESYGQGIEQYNDCYGWTKSGGLWGVKVMGPALTNYIGDIMPDRENCNFKIPILCCK
jgi:hypothetical protein